MRTVILGEPPKEVQALIDSRRSTGADLYDEVWEGDYHMTPAAGGPHGDLDGEFSALLRPAAKGHGLANSGPFNLGTPDDYRVPDRGLRRRTKEVWFDTAALVLEIVSPDDESWEKFEFYAAHGVDELVIADPMSRAVAWFVLVDSRYEPTEHSALLDGDVTDIIADIDWPPAY